MNIGAIQAVIAGRLSVISMSTRFLEAARLFSGGGFRMLLVCKDTGEVVGVVTRTDAMRHIVGNTQDPLSALACDLMSPLVVAAHASDDLLATWQMMVARGLNHVPVLDAKGKPLGILTSEDALKVLLQSEQYEEHLLADYVAGIGYR